MRRFRWPTCSSAFLLLLGALASRAGAAADLDGDWQFATDTFLRCARTGSDVTCQSLPSLLTLTGTNDIATGDFSFVVPPVPTPTGSGPVPPGPDGSFTGTVAPNGQTFTGTLVLCEWATTYWQCSALPLNGNRFDGPAVCGNGLTEPGERCDQGTAGGVSLNGDQCCSATCELVDPDGDLICSRFDDCPVTSNVDQTDTNHDGIGDACDPGTAPDGPLTIRRLQHRYRSGTRASMKLDATYAGAVDVPSVIEVSPVQCGDVVLSTSSQGRELQGLWGSRICTVRATSARCKSRFEDMTLQLTVRRAGDGGVRLKLSIAGLSFCSPGLTPPAHVALLHAGGSRGGTISSCVVRTSDAGGFWTDCAP
jgi:hypothetical protein